MSHIPVLKPKEVIQILVQMGFFEVRQKGSHKQFKNNQGSIGVTIEELLSHR